MRVISDRSESRPGDVVLQLSAGGGVQPVLSVDNDVMGNSFIEDIQRLVDAKGGVNMKILKEKIRKQKKRQKDIKAFLKKIKQGQKAASGGKKRHG